MHARYLCIYVVLGLTELIGGCFGPQRNDYVSARQISPPNRSVVDDQLWQSAQEALRRHHLRLDRVDRRAGIITTMPASSQHLFEFWRRDVDTWPGFWEASLNPIRRRVEVTFSLGDDGAWTQIAVAVFKQRLSSPDRQFNSTGAAYQYFGNSLPATTGEPNVTAADDRWLDMGRDAAMEERILNVICESASGASGDGNSG